MKVIRSARFAALALIICVVFGTLISARRSLLGLKGEVDALFYDAPESIASDIAERMISANDLLLIARRYLPENDPAIAAMTVACGDMASAAGPAAAYDANEALTQAAYGLVSALEKAQMTERDAATVKRLPADMQSRNDYIKRSPYNDEAARYNAVLAGFPAGALARLTGVGHAEYFR